jgi:hypothetical protein
MRTMTDPAPDVLIADIEKNRREVIRIQLRTFKGRRHIDARVHFLGDDGTYLPTGKGISIRPDLLPDVIGALQKAEEAARAEGLLT